LSEDIAVYIRRPEMWCPDLRPDTRGQRPAAPTVRWSWCLAPRGSAP